MVYMPHWLEFCHHQILALQDTCSIPSLGPVPGNLHRTILEQTVHKQGKLGFFPLLWKGEACVEDTQHII